MSGRANGAALFAGIVISCACCSLAVPPVPSTMQAVQGNGHGCSKPEWKCVNEVTTETPKSLASGEVLVRIAASSVNPVDVDMVGPGCETSPAPFHCSNGTLGSDGAGIVVASRGDACSGLSVGQAVWGFFRGSYAQYAVARCSLVVPIPSTMTLVEAASMPVVASTSLQCLQALGQVRSQQMRNSTVVITSGQGGTGFVAIQIAKALGATTIITAATGNGIAFVKSVGADIIIDYKKLSIASYLGNNSVDLVFDNLGEPGTADAIMHAIRPGGGLLVLLGGNGGTISKHPKVGVKQIAFGVLSPNKQLLTTLNRFFQAQSVRAHILGSYSLNQVGNAFTRLRSPGVLGKISIVVASRKQNTPLTEVEASGTPDVIVQVDTAATSTKCPAIQPNFVGFSLEVTGIRGVIGSNGTNVKYAQALRNLARLTPGLHPGPVIRIGGNSADESCFGSGPVLGCRYNISDADLNAYSEFARKTARDLNLSYVIDTNFGTSRDPYLVATKHIQRIGDLGMWDLVRAVEIGNEIDIYAKGNESEQLSKGHRNMSYDYHDYEVEFGNFMRAHLASGMPHARIQGATYCCMHHRGGFDGNWSRYLSVFRRELRSVSYHAYPTSHCGGRPVSTSDLLSDASVSGRVGALSPFIKQALGAGVPFWVGEGNSCSCGGMPGVSDTFASALWSIDFLAALSQAGASGMNFHGSSNSLYTPIGFDASSANIEIRPLYYGLYAFSELAANYSCWLPTTVTTSVPPPEADPTCQHGIKSGFVCCAASCGACGGAGCDKRPGGANACCASSIVWSNVSCTSAEAPCLIDPDYTSSPVVAHSTRDAAGRVKVMLIRRRVRETSTLTVQVCTSGPAQQYPSAATLRRLTAPSLDSKYAERIMWGGFTFANTTDGAPRGQAVHEVIKGFINDGHECFLVDMEAHSAAMLVIEK